MSAVRFSLKPEHLALLRRAYIGWDNCEYGAPAIDCKRPYGNSDVEGDIGEILGIAPAGAPGEHDDEPYFTDEQRAEFAALHIATRDALQIILSTGSFEPGVYERERYGSTWKRVGPLEPEP